jgi:hypothetical protein
MGPLQHTPRGNTSTRGKDTRGSRSQPKRAERRRLGRRTCLRKGCGRDFQASRRNQLYCQDPECLHEVRRWHGAKRQRRCRATAEGRRKHAQAERERRQRRRVKDKVSPIDKSSPKGTQGCAWSRRKDIPEILCNRPGCYNPPRSSPRVPARYCSDACRQAMRRVQDRERKHKRRSTFAGRFKRQLEYERARRCRQKPLGVTPAGMSRSVPAGLRAVGHYRAADPKAVFLAERKEGCHHDRETRADPRARSPPAS